MILAIDTSLGTSFALVDGDRVVIEHRGEDTRRHAETLGPLIAEAMQHRADITEVVVGMGPGAFTGLRVGIAAGESIATGLGVPCRKVCSHDAAGLAATQRTMVTSDVRRGERGWSIYDGGRRTEGPTLSKADALPAPAGTVRVDIDTVDAVALARFADRSDPVPQALYLWPADAVVPGAPKRVSA